MRTASRWAWWGVLAVLLAGCVTTSVNTITNLTPSRLPRKETGLYAFSVEFDSRQRTLLHETMRVYVVVGEEYYEMERTPLTPHRWETLVPVPATQDLVNYRYRFDYDYKAIPTVQSTSRETRVYQLIIQPR
jgi:hypothetical protein